MAVTLVHWGFAVYGGLLCVAFIAAPSEFKPQLLPLVLVPQGVWVWFVVRRARAAELRAWG